MVITKTPFRLSFFGGGTDFPEFFNKNGGAVLSAAFDKYCFVKAENAAEEIQDTVREENAVYGIRRPAALTAVRMLKMPRARLSCWTDLPEGSGLGTSSAFAVGMLNALYALKGLCVDKQTLADQAIYLERTLCREAGGWQDQIAAVYGGINRIRFQDGNYEVCPVRILPEKKKRLNSSLMLFFTGSTRDSSKIQQQNHIASEENTIYLREMLALVEEAEKLLTEEKADLDDFGRLLHLTWMLKKKTGSRISTDYIDGLYQKAVRAGALGGKLLGAGGGGFLLFYVPPERQRTVARALEGLMYVPFGFEDKGTRIQLYSKD